MARKTKNGAQVWCHATKNGVKVLYESGKKIYLPADRLPLPTERKTSLNQLISPEPDKLDPQHHKLYSIAMHGLQVVQEKEVKKMSPKQKGEVLRFYQRAQRVINNLKNTVLEKDLKTLCKKAYSEEYKRFEKEPRYNPSDLFTFTFLNELCSVACPQSYDDVPNKLPLSFLGITKQRVVESLIRENLSLPPCLQLSPALQPGHP